MAFVDKMIPEATKRLTFRFFQKDDLPLVKKLNSNPSVTQYLGGVQNQDVIEMSLKRYVSYHKEHPGYGYWCTFLKQEQVFVGFFVMKLLIETGEPELGYRLLPEYWGRGLATEGAQQIVQYASNSLGLNKVVGVVALENTASKRVLEKAGLRFRKNGRFYQSDCAYYDLLMKP